MYLLKLTNEVNYSQKIFDGFRDVVSESEDIYPGIDLWFKHKVVPGIKQGERFAYLIMNEGKAIAETIIKKDIDTKLCSMRITPEYQNIHLGPVLFEQIAKSIDWYSETIHFTAPESLAFERNGLFEKLGFFIECKSKKSYRKGEEEFVFKASTKNFKQRAFELVENNSFNFFNNPRSYDSMVMSIKPKYAELILNNKKSIEIRTKFSKNCEGITMFIYASKPVQCIIGEARISSVVKEKPEIIWDLYNEKIGCTQHEYNSYCKRTNKVNALVLDDIRPYANPIPWATFATTFNAPLKPPQSYQFLKPSGFIPEETLVSEDVEIYEESLFQIFL